jgi:hypothetical protein
LILLALGVGCLGVGCTQPAPKTQASSGISPETVPSLALLGSGEGLERSSSVDGTVSGSGSGQSCEAVRDEEAEKARSRGVDVEEPPDEHGEKIRAVLDDGSYLNACDVSPRATVELCAAIMNGQARGVTVTMQLGTRAQADCVADEVRKLEFPEHELVFIARTAFDP